jgi:hypothetical protein
MRLTNLSCAAVAALTLAASGVVAASAQDGAASNAAAACADIADAQARLDCYDAAVGRAADPAAPPQVVAPAQPGPAPAAPSAAAPAAVAPPPAAVAAAPASPEDTFGLRERREPESASFAVARLTTDARGDKLRVVMENGQVWTQIDYNAVRAPRDEEIVAEVTPGALDSYFMSLNGGPRFRVRRDR